MNILELKTLENTDRPPHLSRFFGALSVPSNRPFRDKHLLGTVR